MKDEYDFSAAERGKFHRPGAVLTPPVRLAPDVLAHVGAEAARAGVSVEEYVNTLLRARLENDASHNREGC